MRVGLSREEMNVSLLRMQSIKVTDSVKAVGERLRGMGDKVGVERVGRSSERAGREQVEEQLDKLVDSSHRAIHDFVQLYVVRAAPRVRVLCRHEP